MLALFYVPRYMTWQDAIVAHMDIIGLARREARRRPGGRPRLLRLCRLIRSAQRPRVENRAGHDGISSSTGGSFTTY